MTVSTQTAKSQYTGNGVTTAFTGSFPILDQTHITVILTVGGVDTTQLLTTNYTVSGVGNPTHTVTFLVAPANGARVTIARNVPLTQELDLVENADLPSTELEKSYDKAVMIDQQLKETADRAIRIPISDPAGTGTTFPNVAGRANKLAGFDGSGAPTVYDPTILGATGAVYADYLRTQFSGDSVTTVFTLPADPLTRDNVNIFISGVYQQKDRYAVAGTTLTFVTAPPTGTNNIEVIQGQGLLATAAPPPDGSVTTQKIADGAVTSPKIPSNAVTLDKLARVGTAGQVLTSNGTGADPSYQTQPRRRILQHVAASYRTAAAPTGTIPYDDTIPQVGEGTQILSVTTPLAASSATNRWLVTVVGTIAHSVSGNPVGIALFKDGAANAVHSTIFTAAAPNQPVPFSLTYEDVTGNTSAATFTVRVGGTSGSTYLNGDATRKYGGALGSTIVVQEIDPS